MATTIAAAGDLIYGTANDAYTRLGIGTAGHYLKVNSGATAPEWAEVSAGAGNMTQIATGSTTSGSSFTVSGLSSYSEIVIFLYSVRIISANRQLTLRLNSNSGSEYDQLAHRVDTANTAIQNFITVNDSAFYLTHTNMDANQAQTSWAIKLTNCKNPGFTDMDFTANYAGIISFEGKGVYTVSEAISSFTVAVGSPATWDNGTYTVWGA